MGDFTPPDSMLLIISEVRSLVISTKFLIIIRAGAAELCAFLDSKKIR